MPIGGGLEGSQWLGGTQRVAVQPKYKEAAASVPSMGAALRFKPS